MVTKKSSLQGVKSTGACSETIMEDFRELLTGSSENTPYLDFSHLRAKGIDALLPQCARSGDRDLTPYRSWGSTVRLSQTPRERGLSLAQSAPHGKQNRQTPDGDSSLSLRRLPPLRPKGNPKPHRA